MKHMVSIWIECTLIRFSLSKLLSIEFIHNNFLVKIFPQSLGLSKTGKVMEPNNKTKLLEDFKKYRSLLDSTALNRYKKPIQGDGLTNNNLKREFDSRKIKENQALKNPFNRQKSREGMNAS